MKTNRKFILLVLIASATLVANYSYAQDPTLGAVVPEDIVGVYCWPSDCRCNSPVSLRVQNTGNDIIDYNGSRFEVTVWDDVNGTGAGLGWNVFDGTTWHKCWSRFWKSAYGLYAYDPDVCLVTNPHDNEVYAIAVYWAVTNSSIDPSPGLYIMEVWNWNTSSNLFTPILGSVSGDFYPNNLYTGGTATIPYGTTLNIDGNTDGNFVITWDSYDKILALAGSTPGPFPGIAPYPGLENSANWVGIASNGYMPDVALNSIDPGNSLAYFTYVDPSIPNDKVVAVDVTTFASIASGSPSVTPACVPQHVGYPNSSCNELIQYPRIACPPFGGPPTWQDNFHVVYSTTTVCGDPLYGIHGLNKILTSVTDRIYNDGTVGGAPFKITYVPNTRPVTTYDNMGEGIWVGWEFDNIAGILPNALQTGITKGKYPLAIQCFNNGDWNTGNCPYYLEVPVATALPGASHSLSIAGRHTVSMTLPPMGDNLYSFYEDDGSSVFSVYTKTVPQAISPAQLRTDGSDLKHVEGFPGVFNSLSLPDGADANTYSLLLSVHDISGKLLMIEEGNIYQLERSYTVLSRHLSPGIYIAGLRSPDGKTNLNCKVFINPVY